MSPLAAAAARAGMEATRLVLIRHGETDWNAQSRLQGLTRQQTDQQQPALARRWHRREPDFGPEGAESLRDFQARCLAPVARLAATDAGRSMALVSHGGVLDGRYRAATGRALDASRSWALGNAGINRLLHTPQALVLVGWGDSAHRDGLALDEAAG